MKDYRAAQTRRREESKGREWIWTTPRSQHGNQQARALFDALFDARGLKKKKTPYIVQKRR